MTINKLQGKHFQNALYPIAGVSKQAYHQHWLRQAKMQQQDNAILSLVRKMREQHKKMGSRLLFHVLKPEGMGINKFEKMIAANGYGIERRRKRIITTQGVHEHSDVNLINGLILSDINEVIVGDISYVQSGSYTFYVFTLKDAYSKRIVGLLGSDNMMSINAINTLKQVIRLRKKDNLAATIHHTDAGSQYKSTLYKQLLATCKMQRSIAENCLQNGMAEQLNDVIKNNYLVGEHITSAKQFNKLLKKIKQLINEERPVAALGYRTPVAFEAWIKEIPVDQRPQIKLYDFNK